MEVIERKQVFEAKCNECGSIHETFAGEVKDDESAFCEYLISLDPNHENDFLLAMKLIGDGGYISVALNVALNDSASLTYIDQYPLSISHFDWVNDIQSRGVVLENGIDKQVMSIIQEILMPLDSRVSQIFREWTESE